MTTVKLSLQFPSPWFCSDFYPFTSSSSVFNQSSLFFLSSFFSYLWFVSRNPHKHTLCPHLGLFHPQIYAHTETHTSLVWHLLVSARQRGRKRKKVHFLNLVWPTSIVALSCLLLVDSVPMYLPERRPVICRMQWNGNYGVFWYKDPYVSSIDVILQKKKKGTSSDRQRERNCRNPPTIRRFGKSCRTGGEKVQKRN